MKKLKQIVSSIKGNTGSTPDEYNSLLWQLICYSPKMPVRLLQQQLLDEAKKFSLTVADNYFANKELVFNGYKWGTGKYKVLITHGWGSKAADFSEIITALKELDSVQIIAFDAPGNGSSEGELSNLLLFTEAVKAIVAFYGEPDIIIGHSLGGMANVMAVQDMGVAPSLIINLTPLIRLKENFEDSMTAAEVPKEAQALFLQSFEDKFNKPAAFYNLHGRYRLDGKINHWLAYDKADKVSTFSYMEEFLNNHPAVKSTNYEGAGHDRIIKSPQLINDLVNEIKAALEL